LHQRTQVGRLPRRQPALRQYAQQHVLAALSRIGLAPQRRSTNDTAAVSASRAASGSESQRAARRSKDDSMCSGSPADPPGVNTRTHTPCE